jgi:phage terminase Nu1 subunit (DNA packaging protein)
LSNRSRGGGELFDLEQVLPWCLEHGVGNIGANGSGNGDGGATAAAELGSAKARKTEADAKLSELRYAQAVGQVIDIATVTDMVGRHVTACRARLLSLPSVLAPSLAIASGAPECQSLLEGAIRECLEELGSGGFGEVPAATR